MTRARLIAFLAIATKNHGDNATGKYDTYKNKNPDYEYSVIKIVKSYELW